MLFAISLAAHGDQAAESTTDITRMHVAYLDDSLSLADALIKAREFAPRYFAHWNIYPRVITISISNQYIGEQAPENLIHYHEQLQGSN